MALSLKAVKSGLWGNFCSSCFLRVFSHFFSTLVNWISFFFFLLRLVWQVCWSLWWSLQANSIRSEIHDPIYRLTTAGWLPHTADLTFETEIQVSLRVDEQADRKQAFTENCNISSEQHKAMIYVVWGGDSLWQAELCWQALQRCGL